MNNEHHNSHRVDAMRYYLESDIEYLKKRKELTNKIIKIRKKQIFCAKVLLILAPISGFLTLLIILRGTGNWVDWLWLLLSIVMFVTVKNDLKKYYKK